MTGTGTRVPDSRRQPLLPCCPRSMGFDMGCSTQSRRVPRFQNPDSRTYEGVTPEAFQQVARGAKQPRVPGTQGATYRGSGCRLTNLGTPPGCGFQINTPFPGCVLRTTRGYLLQRLRRTPFCKLGTGDWQLPFKLQPPPHADIPRGRSGRRAATTSRNGGAHCAHACGSGPACARHSPPRWPPAGAGVRIPRPTR